MNIRVTSQGSKHFDKVFTVKRVYRTSFDNVILFMTTSGNAFYSDEVVDV